MIVAEYSTDGDALWRRVVVDPAAGTVAFFRCHRTAGFWSLGVDPEYACPLAEVRWRGWEFHFATKYGTGGMGRLLEIVTPAGVALLPEAAAGYADVVAALAERHGPPPEPRWTDGRLFAVLKLYLLVAAAMAFVLLLIVAVDALGISAKTVGWVACAVMFLAVGAVFWLAWRRPQT